MKCGDLGVEALAGGCCTQALIPNRAKGRPRPATHLEISPMTTVATRPLILARPGVWVKGGGMGGGGQAEAGGGKGVFLRHHRITEVRVGRPLRISS